MTVPEARFTVMTPGQASEALYEHVGTPVASLPVGYRLSCEELVAVLYAAGGMVFDPDEVEAEDVAGVVLAEVMLGGYAGVGQAVGALEAQATSGRYQDPVWLARCRRLVAAAYDIGAVAA